MDFLAEGREDCVFSGAAGFGFSIVSACCGGSSSVSRLATVSRFSAMGSGFTGAADLVGSDFSGKGASEISGAGDSVTAAVCSIVFGNGAADSIVGVSFDESALVMKYPAA